MQPALVHCPSTRKASFTIFHQFLIKNDMPAISAHAADIGGYLFLRENAALWKDAGGATGHLFGHVNGPSQGPLNYYRP